MTNLSSLLSYNEPHRHPRAQEPTPSFDCGIAPNEPEETTPLQPGEHECPVCEQPCDCDPGAYAEGCEHNCGHRPAYCHICQHAPCSCDSDYERHLLANFVREQSLIDAMLALPEAGQP